jgi:simple sugar transport system permease protein
MGKIRLDRYSLLELLAPLLGFLAAVGALMAIVLIVGESPPRAVSAILRMTVGTSARLATIFSVAIPLYIAGLAVALAFQANVFNIGVEGQYFIGGLAGALAGIYLPLPSVLHLPVVVLCAMAGGALWAAVPTFLKVGKGIHEVITTIMFNNIAVALVNYLVNGPLSGRQGGSLEAQTRRILPTALFGKLNPWFRALGLDVPNHVYLDYSLIVAAIFGVLTWLLLFRLRYGFEIRAVGTSLEVARYSGIRVKRIQAAAFLASGALAGLIGLQEIFAVRGFYTFEIAPGLGFDGIAIALIGRNSPIGIIFSSILFAFLKQAGYGMQLYTAVPNAVVYVITGLMVLFIVIINEVVTRRIRALRKKEAG